MESVAMGESAQDSDDIANSAKTRAKEAAELSKRVGLSEDSLGTTEAEIIESARLDGWTTPYPDISSIGYPDRQFEPMISPNVVKRLFTQSQVLRDRGWRFEMLERQLTEDDDAPYKKLYQMSIPENASPPVPTDPPKDTVQARYTEDDTILISFDPGVLEWYPSVVIPLPQHDLFAYLLGEIQQGVDFDVDSNIVKLSGQMVDSGIDIRQEPQNAFTPKVSTYASSQSAQRLTLDFSLPRQRDARNILTDWLEMTNV